MKSGASKSAGEDDSFAAAGGVDMADDKPKWDQPSNVKSSKSDPAGDLARKHGISPDRAQMLIDRLGHDPKELSAAAEGVRLNPKR